MKKCIYVEDHSGRMRSLRPKEVADILGVNKTTLRRMEDRGELHPIRLPNGHRRYRAEEIERIIGGHLEG